MILDLNIPGLYWSSSTGTAFQCQWMTAFAYVWEHSTNQLIIALPYIAAFSSFLAVPVYIVVSYAMASAASLRPTLIPSACVSAPSASHWSASPSWPSSVCSDCPRRASACARSAERCPACRALTRLRSVCVSRVLPRIRRSSRVRWAWCASTMRTFVAIRWLAFRPSVRRPWQRRRRRRQRRIDATSAASIIGTAVTVRQRCASVRLLCRWTLSGSPVRRECGAMWRRRNGPASRVRSARVIKR